MQILKRSDPAFAVAMVGFVVMTLLFAAFIARNVSKERERLSRLPPAVIVRCWSGDHLFYSARAESVQRTVGDPILRVREEGGRVATVTGACVVTYRVGDDTP